MIGEVSKNMSETVPQPNPVYFLFGKGKMERVRGEEAFIKWHEFFVYV